MDVESYYGVNVKCNLQKAIELSEDYYVTKIKQTEIG